VKRKRIPRTYHAPKAAYVARPELNVALTDEQAAEFKRRKLNARRAIEDAALHRELGLDDGELSMQEVRRTKDVASPSGELRKTSALSRRRVSKSVVAP